MSEIETRVEQPSQERVRKAVCHESGPHGLEQGERHEPYLLLQDVQEVSNQRGESRAENLIEKKKALV